MATITKFTHKPRNRTRDETLTTTATAGCSSSFSGKRAPGDGYSKFSIHASYEHEERGITYYVEMNREEATRIVKWLTDALEDKAT